MKECWIEIVLYVVDVKKGYHHPLEVVMMVGYQRTPVLIEIAVLLDCLEAAVGMIELEVPSWNLGSFRHRLRLHHGCHHVEAS